MKLSFFQKPVRYVPPHQEGSLQDYRERIVSILLTSASTLGALAFVAAFIPALRAHQYGSIGIFTVCYAWVLIITLQRRQLSYKVKIYSLLFLFYLLGLINLVQNGISSDSGVFLLAFTVMTSLMIGIRSGIAALLIGLSTYTLAGVLMTSGKFVPPVLISYHEPMDWLSGGVLLMLLSIILASSVNIILRGLTDSMAKVKNLVIDTDRDRAQLRRHSQDLQRRLTQLQAVAEIEHSISAVMDPRELQQKVVDLLSERFGLYFVGIFLFDESMLSKLPISQEGESPAEPNINFSNRSGAEVILQAGNAKTVPQGYRLRISGTPGIGWAVQNRKPRAVDISGRKDEFTANYLPLAHTELALPLVSHDRVIGALMIHSTQSNAFDGDDIALFQSLAESLATALENARVFKQTQEDLEEIRILQRQYQNRTWAEAEQIHGNLSYTYEAGVEHSNESASVNTDLSVYSTPISLRDQRIGQITLEADKPAWLNEDRTFIDSVITEAALALENARLVDETLRRANHDRLVADITRTVRASTDIETILSVAIRELGRNLGSSEAVITMNVAPQSAGQVTQGGMSETGDSHSHEEHIPPDGENPSQLASEGPVQQEAT